MRLLQIASGIILFSLGVNVFLLGWRDYHGESARMSRYMGEKLGISRPFWSHHGVPEMAGGMTGAVVGLVLLVGGLASPKR